MKAYSEDLRERVVRAMDQGLSQAEVAKLFGISVSSIKRYLKQRHQTGHLHRKPVPGRPSKKFAPLQAGLIPQLEAHPDATCQEHCQLWEQAHGLRVSPTTMARAIKRVGWTRKKRRWEPQNAMKPHERSGNSSSPSLMPTKSL